MLKRHDPPLEKDGSRIQFKPVVGPPAEPDAPPVAEVTPLLRENSPVDGQAGVGVLLQASRRRLGLDLRETAVQLRIRYDYLRAIEGNRHDELPGATYALGFVRSYAEFLGLDAEEVVRRYKDESQQGEIRPELSFPKPMQEGRIPGGALMFVALLVAGLTYGGWYYLSARGTDLVELVEPLPDRLMAVVNKAPADGTTETPAAIPDPGVPAPPVKATPPEASAAEAPESVTPASAPVDPAPQVAVAPEPTEPSAAPEPPAARGAAPAPTAMATVTPGPEPDSAPAVHVDPPQSETVAEPAPQERAADTAAQEVAAIPQAPDVAALPDGRVFGDSDDSRVLIRAVERSWVRVVGDGEVIMTRMLQPGDSYRVPPVDGLVLKAGNAGALEIDVDGRTLSPLGDYGEVLSNYSLKPEELLTRFENAGQ